MYSNTAMSSKLSSLRTLVLISTTICVFSTTVLHSVSAQDENLVKPNPNPNNNNNNELPLSLSLKDELTIIDEDNKAVKHYPSNVLDGIDEEDISFEKGQEHFQTAMTLLGGPKSPSRDTTSVHILTSVGRSADVQEAYRLLKLASEMGNLQAMEMVAWAQVVGPLELNLKAAKQSFEILGKDLGRANSQMGLGFFTTTGLYEVPSTSAPIVYYTFASADSSWAQMALGYRYWAGIGVEGNCEKALEQYRRVANVVASEVSLSGTGPAIQRIRLLDEVEGSVSSSGNILNSDILDYYSMLAERGDVQAQVGLGQLHFQGGRGISPDHHLALKYFQRAADGGSAVAMAFLGKMYLEGTDAIEADNATALRWFQRAAEQGSPVGQSGLGLMYLTGRGLDKDPSKAMQYFTMAAEQGWVDGQLHLGNMYMSGIGVRRDYSLAAKYYNLAAQSGHILAIYNLAQMHGTGTGMMRSCTAAVELYKSVAERGRWGMLLAEAHYDVTEKRYSEGLVKYFLLSELGYEAAQSNAAFLLERDEVGTELRKAFGPDLGGNTKALALRYWSRSAAQGYSPARVRLGDYYYYGWGTHVDYTSAATQYRSASELQRNPQAMFNLAYMHEQGLGLSKDIHLAKRFYDMAAETSLDAKIPVALALFKLNLVQMSNVIGPNWDLYFISGLVGVLGLVVYFRRPH